MRWNWDVAGVVCFAFLFKVNNDQLQVGDFWRLAMVVTDLIALVIFASRVVERRWES